MVVVLVAAAVWFSLHFLQPAPPRRIVLASGAEFGAYHQYAKRYQEILARDGVKVEERLTSGAADNLRLLLDPKSGVDVAFMQGGVATFPAADDLVMLPSLYYEPLWIFYGDSGTLSQLNDLQGKRIAVGAPGSGTRALADNLFAANGLTVANGVGRGNTEIVGLGGNEALEALRAGKVDAALFVGGAQTPLIVQALRDPAIKLMSVERAEAYQRRLSYITRLTLPAGTIDLATNIPRQNVEMVGTKAMLAARDGLHPALINMLIDAAREIHGEQGYFEAAGEFPGTSPVDLRVSAYADQHKRFGPSFLYRYLPFWSLPIVERTIILMVTLLVVLVPLMNFLPQFRAGACGRASSLAGELALMGATSPGEKGALPIEQWLHDLDRIERAVGQIRTPAKFASEAYTLREHIGLVRRAVMARAGAPAASGQ